MGTLRERARTTALELTASHRLRQRSLSSKHSLLSAGAHAADQKYFFEVMYPKVLKSRYVLQKRWVRVREDMLKFSDGSVAPWYVREVGAVGRIFCLTKEGKVILVRMYKPGARKIVTELPTGLVDKGENPKATAIRELREETGYVVDPRHVQQLGVYEISPTETEGKVHLFIGRHAMRVGIPVKNPHEEGEVLLVTLVQALRFVQTGVIEAMGQVASVYVGLDYLGYFKTRKMSITE